MKKNSLVIITHARSYHWPRWLIRFCAEPSYQLSSINPWFNDFTKNKSNVFKETSSTKCFQSVCFHFFFISISYLLSLLLCVLESQTPPSVEILQKIVVTFIAENPVLYIFLQTLRLIIRQPFIIVNKLNEKCMFEHDSSNPNM